MSEKPKIILNSSTKESNLSNIEKSIINFFVLILYAALFSCMIFLMHSCETKNVEIQETNYSILGAPIEQYSIDSCEYIGFIKGGNRDWATHKGNCKYCIQRNKQK